MRLETSVAGPQDAPRLAVIHGLFGQGRNWATLQKAWSDEYRVTAVDLRNHGASGWDDDHSYAAMAADLAETLEGPTHVLGHSMGGKAAMVFALTYPEMVERLVVADIAPVTYPHSMMDYVKAMQALDLGAVETRRDANAGLAETVPDEGVRRFLLSNLDMREKRWMLNLDVLEAEMDRISGFPDLDATFPRAALFLSGATSDYVDDEGKAAARRYFPKSRFAEVPDAGHWLHAEKADAVEESVRLFLGA